MADDLPEQFDLIVIGTGFTESCIAAAASRVGKSVLHLDINDYYGNVWGSLGIEDLISLLAREAAPHSTLRNGSYHWHEQSAATPTSETEEMKVETGQVWTQETVLAMSRRFCIDLCPRVLYSAGELVQLLIKSNICRYTEFRAVDNVCMHQNGTIVSIPCSRSDIFNTKSLTIVEKRLLMKFMNACNDYGEDKCNEDTLAFRGKTFFDYLKAQRVTEKIASCVTQAIAMCGPDTSFEEGMLRTQRFLHSLGRYGNTPFLYPMYGCGEFPQSFCRQCAVYGGIYCLKRSVDDCSVDVNSNEVLISSAGTTFRAKHVVSAPRYLPASRDCVMRPHLSRGLFLSSTPLGNDVLNKGGGGVNILRLMDNVGAREAIFIQLSHYSGACPKGLYLFHLTTPAISDDPASDLRIFTLQLFQYADPEIIFSSYFTLTAQSQPDKGGADNIVYYTDAPSYEMDYYDAIANARHIFGKLYTDVEFLPRAPDVEEIVVDGEDPSALNEHSLPEDLRAQLQDMQQATEEMDIQD
ncbi:rab proteins geranylgeranyltransferase component A [Drosophila pseudoobscura]|uniref:Rab proteins geranylgeranyltransferase component A n=1 Tax=Drosophila pseudoobscura pseudoobscura TaxID=46245 RepID=A0A6I8UUB4_DROPS|nr:rab proteins geranylgeranyltransferase component A [Drosophila pseudoobscura]